MPLLIRKELMYANKHTQFILYGTNPVVHACQDQNEPDKVAIFLEVDVYNARERLHEYILRPTGDWYPEEYTHVSTFLWNGALMHLLRRKYGLT